MSNIRVYAEPCSGEYELWVDHAGFKFPAGSRLAKGGIFPIKTFRFKKYQEALEAVGELQVYLDATNKTKVKETRKHEEVKTSIFG